MKYFSTRSEEYTANGPEAILKGIAPDGGLYTPLDFSHMQISLADILCKSPEAISAEVIGKLLPDFSREEMQALIHDAYDGKFETSELTPIVGVGNAFVLELFRGPTSAFKDVALSVLPRLIVASREKLNVDDDVLILTATSGDTGKAALEGFKDVPGTKMIVFYPDGGVSDVQRAQMVTQEGENVKVCALKGNFDDAQTGVKAIFADDQENKWAQAQNVRLSSANSINLGRLAPQVAYYFKAYTDLVLIGKIVLGDEINFVVPTGNFGDILAGELARRMGLPIARLICASNANNVLTDFINTGRYDRRREFLKTISPSMDILVSSNLERYLFLASDGDCDLVKQMMTDLQEKGCYDAPEELMLKMRRYFSAYCADDNETKEVIRRVWKEEEYLLDPHTAVAWAAYEKYQNDVNNDCLTVVLATASPYKFAKDVLDALGEDVPEDGFDAMEKLNKVTGEPIPARLAALRGKEVRFEDSISRDQMLDYVKESIQ